MRLEDRILITYQTMYVLRMFDLSLAQDCGVCMKPDIWVTYLPVLVSNALRNKI